MPRIVPKPFPEECLLTDTKALGAAVRSARTHSGLSIEEAALIIGVAKQTISDIEAGKPGVGIGLVLRVASQVGVSLFMVPSTSRSEVHNLISRIKP